MSENKALVAICAGHAQAERAILELKRLGFDVKNLSVFGKAYASEEEFVGLYTAGGRLWARGGSVAFWAAPVGLARRRWFLPRPRHWPGRARGFFCPHARCRDRRPCGSRRSQRVGHGALQPWHPQGQHSPMRDRDPSPRVALVALGSSELVTKAMAWLKKAGISEVATGDGCLLGNPDKVFQTAH